MQGRGKEPSIRMIWGLAKSPELSMTDEELHLLVEAQTGKEHISSLTKREISNIVALLARMKESSKRGSRRKYAAAYGNSQTDGQRRKIYKLQEELGWNEARVNGMCRRMFRIDKVEWLDYQQCSKLIEALKKMLERTGTDAGLQGGT